MKKCHKVTDLIPKQQDQMCPSLSNRIAFAIHLSLCPCCREHKEQLVSISNAMHKMLRRFKKGRLEPTPASFKRPFCARLIYR